MNNPKDHRAPGYPSGTSAEIESEKIVTQKMLQAEAEKIHRAIDDACRAVVVPNWVLRLLEGPLLGGWRSWLGSSNILANAKGHARRGEAQNDQTGYSASHDPPCWALYLRFIPYAG